MNTRLKFFANLTFFWCLLTPAFAYFPAGGVLSLDGVDDYAILPFDEHGPIFPKNTREFTVEMWLMPKTEPNPGEAYLLLSQQLVFRVDSHQTAECKQVQDALCGFLSATLHGDGGGGAMVTTVPLEQSQWNYLAMVYKESTPIVIRNNRILKWGKFDRLNRVEENLEHLGRPKDFFVGGYDAEFNGWPGVTVTRFPGEIDAIRFSKIARYDIPGERVSGPFDPPERFEPDEHTLALWNFDEREGITRFSDASGNGKTLIGMNGASIGKPLAVRPTKVHLTTRWATLKSKSR